jgi:uncharacterized protein (TIGR02246 family)
MATDQIRNDVAASYAAWDEAFATGDAGNVAACYTEDAVLLPPGGEVLDGPAGAKKFFGGLLANGVTAHKLDLIRVMGEDGDAMVVAAARWSAQGKDASGASTNFGGIATHVFARQPDGSLKLRLHTFN